MKEVSEAKRKKEEELLKLPINPASVVGSSGENSSRTLAITAGTTPEAVKSVFFIINISFLFIILVSVYLYAKNFFSEKDGVDLTASGRSEDNTMRAVLPARAPIMVKPKWHAPWKLYR